MLKKLSLAALVAMGGMSFANATPLTEAIKNVDLNGMLRIRFYAEDPDGSHSYRRWRTNGIFIFKVPVAENMKMVVRNSVETNVYVHDDNLVTTPSGAKSSNVDDNIVNNLLFMAYSKDGFNAIVGKIPVATPVTSADPVTPGHGAGVIGSYKVNDNFTGAAFFIDALKNPGDNTGLGTVIAHNVAGVAGIFNTDLVKGQVWYFNVNNVVDSLVTVSLDANLPIDYKVGIHVDYALGDMNNDFAKSHWYTLNNGVKKHFSTDPKNYFNVALSTNIDAVSAKIGYAYTDKHRAAVEFSVDAPIGAVIPTANNYNIANNVDTSSIYGKLGYNVDPKTCVYLAAQYQNAGDDSGNKNNDLAEYTIGAKYKMNKKLGFHVYYDIADWDSKASNNDNNEFRFEAKYTF